MPLPIYELVGELVEQLRAKRRVILQAPTGSGKSTQVPQILLQDRFLESGQVIILQPRRLATRLLASRVAHECGTRLGEKVGYQIRLDNVSSAATKIKYVTEGILLRQLIQDPELKGVSALIFDEFHERHLYGDITLGRALDLQETHRPDLLILVMSATLESESLQNYLQPCGLLRSEGRTFPVEVQFASRRSRPNDPPIWEQAAEAFASQVRAGREGDALVFMPGSYEIHQTIQAIRRRPESKGYLLLPLHGELSPQDQDSAVARYEQPKVVVSTNVAETSLTIDGVRLVIDGGLARIPRYDPNRGMNTLMVEKISQSAADQRTGRAGRTAPGVCLRLWSQAEHHERPAHELPEVKRLDLAEVVLTLKAAGVNDLNQFRWLEAPSESSLAHAEELLTDLGALNPEGGITPIGRKMLAFPVHPRYARMLLAAGEYHCVHQAALIAALTQGRDLLIRNPGREVHAARESLFGDQGSSDFWVLIRAWHYAAENQFRLEACRKVGIHALTARQVGPLLEQFLNIAEREGLPVRKESAPNEAVEKCVLIGFSDRVAQRVDQGTLRCELVHGRRGNLARESVVQKSPLFVAAEVHEIQTADRSVNTILSLATAIQLAWLEELFADEFRTERRVYYESTLKRVQAAEQVVFRQLVLSTRKIEPPPAEAAARILAEEVKHGRITLKDWDHSIDQWILRLNQLSGWCPELELPPLRDEDRFHLIEQLCHGAASSRELRDKPIKRLVHSWLSPDQQALLDQHAPERLPLSNGRQPKITYSTESKPYIALRIQELFGVNATPHIAQGRVPVVVHILAPNMRPVQITEDLANFWREHYPKVKQELQRRYPKHAWP